uniref:Uncharacterized protein n=1 Tax=viral metagenome TaxID=1070528 RepID=A0A6C0EI38_9ZZZZ
MALLFYILIFIVLIIYINKYSINKNLINTNNTTNENLINTNKSTNNNYLDLNSRNLINDFMILANTNSHVNSYDNLYSDNYSKINNDDINDNKNNDESLVKNIDKLNKSIIYENKKYYLIGSAINKYYNQYYLLYEYVLNESSYKNINTIYNDLYSINYDKEIDILESKDNNKYINNKNYEYLLVHLHNNNKLDKSNDLLKYIVEYKISPRSKININEYVVLSQGIFQIGPLIISKIL